MCVMSLSTAVSTCSYNVTVHRCFSASWRLADVRRVKVAAGARGAGDPCDCLCQQKGSSGVTMPLVLGLRLSTLTVLTLFNTAAPGTYTIRSEVGKEKKRILTLLATSNTNSISPWTLAGQGSLMHTLPLFPPSLIVASNGAISLLSPITLLTEERLLLCKHARPLPMKTVVQRLCLCSERGGEREREDRKEKKTI